MKLINRSEAPSLFQQVHVVRVLVLYSRACYAAYNNNNDDNNNNNNGNNNTNENNNDNNNNDNDNDDDVMI